jgi:hypothetical protein
MKDGVEPNLWLTKTIRRATRISVVPLHSMQLIHQQVLVLQVIVDITFGGLCWSPYRNILITKMISNKNGTFEVVIIAGDA